VLQANALTVINQAPVKNIVWDLSLPAPADDWEMYIFEPS
jgi:hypothetical protein